MVGCDGVAGVGCDGVAAGKWSRSASRRSRTGSRASEGPPAPRARAAVPRGRLMSRFVGAETAACLYDGPARPGPMAFNCWWNGLARAKCARARVGFGHRICTRTPGMRTIWHGSAAAFGYGSRNQQL